ncbi:Phosphodiest-domain-containing protein [Diplocarpon rosae]|nr:Phosphodiest-domain-containing protein [Diplocarpon rosae]
MAPPATSIRDESLLAPSAYDEDASSLHSGRSDQDTDSADDEVLMGARSSADVRAHDRNLLLEEEERDKLLEESRRRGRRGSSIAATMRNPLKKLFGKSYAELPTVETEDAVEMGEKNGMKAARRRKGEKRGARSERRSWKKERLLGDAARGEDGQLMYEMEEGGLKEGSSTGASSETEGSDELDRRGLDGLRDNNVKRRSSWRRWCFIHMLIAIGFSILVLGAWKLSLHRKGALPVQKMVSNGTALFAPTTILVSLDGFRADFLKRGITPSLNAFVAEGVSAEYMNPSFPSVTFPNHYTLVTGLYPESHGVVGNTFWDTELKEEFYYTNPNAMQPKWWGGEPLWVTAEHQGIRTAIHMWPGSEAGIMEVVPAFLDKYNSGESLENKASRILELLDKPGQENEMAEVADMRPQLIAAYVPNVDSDGHRYGPNSTEIRVTIKDVDTMLGHLLTGLEVRNLTNIVNVVVVSDHGMATTDITRLIQLESLIDTSLVEHIDGWPLYGLRPKNPADLQPLYNTLEEQAKKQSGFEVYLRDQNMPERYHFSKNEQNIEVYNIICDSLHIAPKPNNGTLRLPFKPIGTHASAGNAEEPSDPDPSLATVSPSQAAAPSKTAPTVPDTQSPSPVSEPGPDAVLSISPIEASSAADPEELSPAIVGVDPPALPFPERPVVADESTVTQDEQDFWAWFNERLDKMKGWFGGLGSGDNGGTDDKSDNDTDKNEGSSR